MPRIMSGLMRLSPSLMMRLGAAMVARSGVGPGTEARTLEKAAG